MLNLGLAAVFFLLIHRGISGSRLRGVLVARMGEGPYLGAFSLLSAVSLGWLIWAYGQAHFLGEGSPAYADNIAVRILVGTIELLAFLFIVLGVLTPNPTSVGQADKAKGSSPVHGMLRITRHPFLWGTAFFAIGHLIIRHDRASLVLFATILVVAVTGTISIDGKRRRQLGEDWKVFAAQTSNIPFLAILSGRQSLRLGEIGLWRIAVALGVFAGLVALHRYISGGVPLI